MLPGIQGRIGILKHHLKLGADLTQLARLHGGKILPVITDDPLRGTLQPHDLSSDGGFAAAGLSHQPQGLSLAHGKAHAVHRMRIAGGMRDDPAL